MQMPAWKSQNVCSCSPGVDPVGGSRPPEQFAQVLSDTFPQDVAGALTLFTAAHHKLVEVGSAVVHRLHGDDGCRTVAGGTERQNPQEGGLLGLDPYI